MLEKLNLNKPEYRIREDCIKFKEKVYGINFNFEYHNIPTEFYSDFENLALMNDVFSKFKDIFDGQRVNNTEDRPVTHFEYRKNPSLKEFNDQTNFMLEIADAISQESFDKIIFFGIGGSQLGPLFLGEALINDFYKNVVMITGSDPEEFKEKVSGLNLEKCIFIIASKSFGTIETLRSYEDVTGRNYLKNTFAITSNIQTAESYGIDSKKIVSFDASTGGRFSSWSPISILLAIFEGEEKYREFLHGGSTADEDLLNNKNKSPCFLMSCQDIYNNNILENQTSLILNYDWKLRNFSKYVQQLEMESNGKSVDKNGHQLKIQTCPIVWGGYGPESQHSFYQMIYQGTKDFNLYLLSSSSDSLNVKQFNGQSDSLIKGTAIDIEECKQTKKRNPTLITIDNISPSTVGALMATWENKTILNSIFWNINAFDQWGVELGKENTKKYL